MKFIVKLIQVPDIGDAEVAEFAIQAPSHIAAIEEAMDNLGDDRDMPTDARSLAYVAEKIERRPEDEPETIFLLKKPQQPGWFAVDGETTREANPEELAALAAENAQGGCWGYKNKKASKRQDRKERRTR